MVPGAFVLAFYPVFGASLQMTAGLTLGLVLGATILFTLVAVLARFFPDSAARGGSRTR